jgi:hypothetical protein
MVQTRTLPHGFPVCLCYSMAPGDLNLSFGCRFNEFLHHHDATVFHLLFLSVASLHFIIF